MKWVIGIGFLCTMALLAWSLCRAAARADAHSAEMLRRMTHEDD